MSVKYSPGKISILDTLILKIRYLHISKSSVDTTSAAFAIIIGSLLLISCKQVIPITSAELTSTTETVIMTSEVNPATSTIEPSETDLLATDTPVSTATNAMPKAQATTSDAESYNISGNICYPTEIITQMTAYFEETEHETIIELAIGGNQTDYQIKLEPGTYIAYAWLTGFSHGGLYSRAVPCGLSEDCDDHTLLPFTVSAGNHVTGIDLCDWYAGPFSVPYPPEIDQSTVTGVLSGTILYPDETMPELHVVAFNTKTGYWYWTKTLSGQTSYQITELPSGIYNIVAYDGFGMTGGHATVDHDLIDVLIEARVTINGVDIIDWHAPVDIFPNDPTR